MTPLLRASLWLAVSAGLASLLLRRPISSSARWDRFAWTLVLLQGIMLSPWTLGIPWYESPAAHTLSNATAAPQFSVDDRPSSAHTPIATRPDGPKSANRQRSSNAWMATVWACGLLALGVSMAASYVALFFELRKSTIAPPSWQAELDQVARQHGVRRSIQLRLSSHLGPLLCRMPGAWFVVAPATGWAQLSSSERTAVLHHEVIHYVRRDVWKSFAARALAALHWFNPAGWWALSNYEQAAEWSCDERLARIAPRSVPQLATALLHFTQRPDRISLSAAANGAPLRTRMKRLLQPPSNEGGAMKRWLLLILMSSATLAGAVQLRLVAQDPPAPDKSGNHPEFARQVEQLRTELPTDGELGRLREALATDEGRMVLRGRAEAYIHEARESATVNALPNYVNQRFVKTESGYQVRPEFAEEARQLVDRTAEYQRDLAKVAEALEKIAGELKGDDEATMLTKRFMLREGPMMLYVMQLRNRLRPTLELLEYRLRNVMVRNADGGYVLREDHRDAVQQMVNKMLPLLKGQKIVFGTMSDWGKDLSEPDELHKRAKQAFKSPAFALFLAINLADKLDTPTDNPRVFANRLADQLDQATRVAANGNVFKAEARPRVVELLDQFESMDEAAGSIRPLLRDMANRMTKRDELHTSWAQLLKSDIGALKVGSDLSKQTQGQDVRDIILDLIGAGLEKTPDGFVLAPDRKAELSKNLQEAIREHRRVNRHGKFLQDVATGISDPSLKAALESEAARFIVAMQVKEELQRMDTDGLRRWQEDNLKRSANDQWEPTDAGKQELKSVLSELEKLRKELEKDDF